MGKHLSPAKKTACIAKSHLRPFMRSHGMKILQQDRSPCHKVTPVKRMIQYKVWEILEHASEDRQGHWSQGSNDQVLFFYLTFTFLNVLGGLWCLILGHFWLVYAILSNIYVNWYLNIVLVRFGKVWRSLEEVMALFRLYTWFVCLSVSRHIPVFSCVNCKERHQNNFF